MNSVRFASTGSEEEMDTRTIRKENRQKNYNWKMSYSVIKTGQQHIIYQQKSTFLSCSYKDKFFNTCPADVKLLKLYTREAVVRDLKPKCEDTDDSEEYESKLDNKIIIQSVSQFMGNLRDTDTGHENNKKSSYAIYSEMVSLLDSCHSDSLLKLPKWRVWDEYKKLLALSGLGSKKADEDREILWRVTSKRKIRVDRLQPRTYTQVRRSIIKSEFQETILIADYNYVQFRNFEFKKVYKKTVTLQNISSSPAKFQIEGRPYCSNFTVFLESAVENNRNIVPPGLTVQLVVFFRCDIIDEPEELVIVNVKNGKSLLIKLHGFRDPPILQGTPMPTDRSYKKCERKSPQSWFQEIVSPNNSINVSSDGSSNSTTDSWSSNQKTAGYPIFDCKKAFIGERIHMPIKIKNVGAEGRFFIMHDDDWISMYIQNITITDILRLSSFVVWPAYFKLKPQEEITLHLYFLPLSYGTHVDRLFILADNCGLLDLDILGDGLTFESNFIQINTALEKTEVFNEDVDKRARYYVKLSTSGTEGIGQCTISVTNISEIAMYFRWTKRSKEFEGKEGIEYDGFPLEYVKINPERGVFCPSAVHNFTVTAEHINFCEICCLAVFQLYVEDIPLTALSNCSQLETVECMKKRRTTVTSVDIWIGDVEVWLDFTTIKGYPQTIFDEIFGSLEELPVYDESSIEDHYVDSEMSDDSEEYKPKHKLEDDELFLHYDIMDLRQFEPLLKEKIISIGVIRPIRTLYIGIEETYVLNVKNLSKNSLIFSWGETNGPDAEKMKLCVCPEKGEVPANNTEKMQISLVPLKEGIVQSLHIPCFVGDKRKVIILGIECAIEPLYVTFYFPLNDPEFYKVENNFAKIEWHVDSIQFALDLAVKSKMGIKLLDKYRMREEQELMDTNLDQGSIVRDVSVGPSESEFCADNYEKDFSSSTSTLEASQSNLTLKNEHKDASVVPFYKTVLPPSTQPVVIEFLNLPLERVKKKTFIIKNETGIPTTFWLRIKNYYPVQCSCEWKSRRDRVKFMYKQIFSRKKHFIEEIVCQMKQPNLGVVIYIDPLNSNIGPFEAVPVDIYVFADTWGIYVDELEINITGLPQYTVGICIQVTESPIILSIEEKSSKIPIIKYGLVPSGTRLQTRKIILKNTSVVPIAVNWHTFITVPKVEPMPFNVVFDFCTKFTDALAARLKDDRKKSDSETHMEEHAKDCEKSKTNNQINFGYKISNDTIEFTNDYLSSKSAASHTDDTVISNDKDLKENEPLPEDNLKLPTFSRRYDLYEYELDTSDIIEENTPELKISILPDYGLVDTYSCMVLPREIFILPKQSATIEVEVHLEKCQREKKCRETFISKILGFIRIAPCDKYRDNWFSRQDGQYFPPIEIDITAEIIRPELKFDIPEYDRTFRCCISDIMNSKYSKVELTKTFFFYNNENTVISVAFETLNPFHVKTISIYSDLNPCKVTGAICINPQQSVEVKMMCLVDENLILNVLHSSQAQGLRETVITLREPLLIMHTTGESQEVELFLEMWLPSIKLSVYTLDFGPVYIGNTKKLLLIVENLSMYNQKIIVKQKDKNKSFETDHSERMLTGYHNREECVVTINVSFEPRDVGQSTETLEIIVDTFNTEECVLYGEGTLDEKFYNPGL